MKKLLCAAAMATAMTTGALAQSGAPGEANGGGEGHAHRQ